jgi:hypothetical protein
MPLEGTLPTCASCAINIDVNMIPMYNLGRCERSLQPGDSCIIRCEDERLGGSTEV